MPGFIGLPEIIGLGLLALILFGPKRLPEMGRGLGKGLREFKDSVSGDHKSRHAFDVPEELTATPIVAEPAVVERPVTEPVVVERTAA
jgi:sec-independent protein translocase protein TatA